MRLSEFLRLLQDIEEGLGPSVDPEVRLAFQPTWPLRFTVATVSVERGENAVVWIAASMSAPYGENPYAPREAWDGEEFGEESDVNEG